MKFGLGKGLGALIPDQEPPGDLEEDADDRQNDEESVPQDDVKVQVSAELERSSSKVSDYEEVDEIVTKKDTVDNIPIDQIVPNPFQPRKIFKPAALQELADSIREHGIIQPLIVTKRSDGIYELLAGERRLQAAKLVGLDKLPAVVRTRKVTDSEKLEIALIENVQREDLNIIEAARAYQRLNEEFGLTHDQIAARVGRGRATISNIIRLLHLPADIQRGLMDGKIAEGHGRALLKLGDREQQYMLFEMIVKKNIPTDQAFEIAKQWTDSPELHRKKRHIKFTEETKALESVMKKRLGIKHIRVSFFSQGGGKAEIQFLNEDEYNQLMEKFSDLT